jgi:hypothetical protein
MNADADHGYTGGFGTFRKDSSAQRILTRAKIGIRDRPNIETVVGFALTTSMIFSRFKITASIITRS